MDSVDIDAVVSATTAWSASDGKDYSKQKRLEVIVMEAVSLSQTDKLGTANAFVTVIWNGRDIGYTNICPNQLNPVWENCHYVCLPVADMMLSHCQLVLKVQNKSRMGTISFLGEHVITGHVLEQLVNANGEEVWFDLMPSRYLGLSGNSLVGGALKCEDT